MGFFSAMKYSGLYDKRIKAYGLEPRELPPNLHSTICSSFERRATGYADSQGFTGQMRSDAIEGSIERAADLLALCLKGPQSYDLSNQIKGFDGRNVGVGGMSSETIIRRLVQDWVNYGVDGSIELKLMGAVNQLGRLHLQFANAFKAEALTRQQSE